MRPTDADAALPPFARAVLALYARALADVRFPDLDLSSLEACAAALHDAQAEAETRLQALRAAEEGVIGRESALTSLAERALAYARIFASGNPALASEVAAIQALSGAEAEAAPSIRKQRGRPRKGAAAQELFEAVAGGDEAGVH